MDLSLEAESKAGQVVKWCGIEEILRAHSASFAVPDSLGQQRFPVEGFGQARKLSAPFRNPR